MKMHNNELIEFARELAGKVYCAHSSPVRSHYLAVSRSNVRVWLETEFHTPWCQALYCFRSM
ncbi:hypothetical protein C7449_1128 [Mycoplana dimorpha]|uniref:Uncharacterized protein n=1 Tax=Mycoplana dimorpha TaxID=28320 RepID=A0A2T5ANQ8_MYCDI|nr:hypothetical protein C7449_1128 [Mycoplana dimorpha]